MEGEAEAAGEVVVEAEEVAAGEVGVGTTETKDSGIATRLHKRQGRNQTIGSCMDVAYNIRGQALFGWGWILYLGKWR